MKKFFAMLLLMTMALSSPAVAENWQFVDEDQVGRRLLINIDTLQSAQVSGYPAFVEATVQVISPNADESFTGDAKIDRETCIKSNNGNLELLLPDSPKPQELFWDVNGTRLYDSVGKFLCGALRASLNESSKAAPQAAPVQMQTPGKAL